MVLYSCTLSLVTWLIIAPLFINGWAWWKRLLLKCTTWSNLYILTHCVFEFGSPVNTSKEKQSSHIISTMSVIKTLFLAVVDPNRDWTPQRLEMCLWAMTVARQQQLALFKDVDLKAGGAAEASSDADASHRPKKKLKTKWRGILHNIFLNLLCTFVPLTNKRQNTLTCTVFCCLP